MLYFFIQLYLAQGLLINQDAVTIEPDGTQGMRARNTNINEDLGKIDYIFSDKTGTLTANEMQLRLIAIKGRQASVS